MFRFLCVTMLILMADCQDKPDCGPAECAMGVREVAVIKDLGQCTYMKCQATDEKGHLHQRLFPYKVGEVVNEEILGEVKHGRCIVNPDSPMRYQG